MTYVYEVIEFNRRFETDNDVGVVEADLSAAGTRASTSANNYALIRYAKDEDFICGYELDSGDECQRTVDSPDDTCWDH